MSRVRVLVVDDSVVVRRLLCDLLAADDGVEVVGTASNGRLALRQLGSLDPDVVVMDVEMPELDGVAAVREMRRAGCVAPVIMFSTVTERGASATLDALAAGATDYVAKPASLATFAQAMEQVRRELVPKVTSLGARRQAARRSAPVATRPVPSSSTRPGTPAPSRPLAPPGPPGLAARRRPPTGYRVLVVGCSTGGPDALSRVLAAMPRVAVPVLVVQHMPAAFTRQLAARLDRLVDAPVAEAVDGQRVTPGSILIAPGGVHLRLAGGPSGPVARLSQDAPENYCRPAVDVLFRSAAALHGPQVLALVLTGMGHDGREGSRAVVAAGGSVLAQDEETSVVWGMPGAVAHAGLAEQVLSLSAIGPALTQRLRAGSPASLS